MSNLPIPKRVAPEVGWLPVSFVNVYFVGRPGAPWILVDTGLPGRAEEIWEAAEARYGGGARPEGIVLTHGHFDHAGSARVLAEHWDVPIYVHPLEFPYLTGKSAYPPPDPTVGGAIGMMSRFFPGRGPDLSNLLRPLEDEGRVPGVDGWRWFHTPGHAPGHVVLFEEKTRTLLAGDAFATMNMERWRSLVRKRPEVSIAGAPFHYDWEASHDSVEELAKLRPRYVACGHGVPMQGAIRKLERFASGYAPPMGRYLPEAAVVDETGVVSVPPAPFDALPVTLVATGAVGLLAAGLWLEERARWKRSG